MTHSITGCLTWVLSHRLEIKKCLFTAIETRENTPPNSVLALIGPW